MANVREPTEEQVPEGPGLNNNVRESRIGRCPRCNRITGMATARRLTRAFTAAPFAAPYSTRTDDPKRTWPSGHRTAGRHGRDSTTPAQAPCASHQRRASSVRAEDDMVESARRGSREGMEETWRLR